MYPSKQKPYAGIFVKNHVEYLRDNYKSEICLDLYYMERTFTTFFGSLVKYINFWLKFTKYLFIKYDVVHIHYIFPNVILAKIYKIFHKNTKVVITLHGEDITVQYPKFKSVLKYFTPKIDLLIPVGETLLNIAKLNLEYEKYALLPVGVNDKIFFKDSKQTKKYDLIFLGSFIHRKGIDYFVNALKIINDRELNIIFIGSGNLRGQIESVRNHKIIIKENLNQNEISGFLNQSKFLVLPSRNEGFPTVTIESFYCGVPVLGSSIPQIREQVEDNYNGFIYTVDNSEDLKVCIKKSLDLSNNQYDKLSLNAANSFANISLSKVCKELINLYNEFN